MIENARNFVGWLRQSYARKYRVLRQPKAPIEFIQGDFCDPEVDVSEVDIVFAYATK